MLVPLASRKATGIVLRSTSSLAPGIEVREALRTLDPEPVLSPELVKLGLWISDYYLAPPGEVFRTMLPLRHETRRARLVHLTDEGRRKMQELAASLLEESKESREAALLAYLARRPGASLEIPAQEIPRRASAGAGREMGDRRGSGKGAQPPEGFCRPAWRDLCRNTRLGFLPSRKESSRRLNGRGLPKITASFSNAARAHSRTCARSAGRD